MSDSDDLTMTKEDKERFEKLFAKLDVNKDGKVEVKELAAALKEMKGFSEENVSRHAKVYF